MVELLLAHVSLLFPRNGLPFKSDVLSSVTREMQFKTMMSTTTFPLEWLKLNRLTSSIAKDALVVKCKMVQPLWKTV